MSNLVFDNIDKCLWVRILRLFIEVEFFYLPEETNPKKKKKTQNRHLSLLRNKTLFLFWTTASLIRTQFEIG